LTDALGSVQIRLKIRCPKGRVGLSPSSGICFLGVCNRAAHRLPKAPLAIGRGYLTALAILPLNVDRGQLPLHAVAGQTAAFAR